MFYLEALIRVTVKTDDVDVVYEDNHGIMHANEGYARIDKVFSKITELIRDEWLTWPGVKK